MGRSYVPPAPTITVQICSKSLDFRFKRIIFNYRLHDARRRDCAINVAICDIEYASVACDIKHATASDITYNVVLVP